MLCCAVTIWRLLIRYKIVCIRRPDIKGIVIAATKSGSGKTTVTLGMMASLSRRGFNVAPFKVGPDFIDPGFHTGITGMVSRNLDGWMLSKEYNIALFNRTVKESNADIAVVEGVMGLFDGYDGKSEAGSTSQMAKWTGLPVVLVVDARSMARSVAPLLQGFERFDPDLNFAGVIFNNLGSQRHLIYLKEAMEGNVAMPCLGGIMRNQEISIPERHLGLFTHHDHPLSDADITRLADIMDQSIDMDAFSDSLFEIEPQSEFSSMTISESPILEPSSPDPHRVRIGVAKDNAFCFYYQDNLDILKSYGAQIIFFSPISDDTLPENIDGLYFGGGYPELFAEELSKNISMQTEVREKSLDSMPVYGECGGFIYLCREILCKDKKSHSMTGCLPFTTQMLPSLKALGYREIKLKKETIIGKPGDVIRGHEFHYSKIVSLPGDTETFYNVADRAGADKTGEGFFTRRTLGSYIHLHFGSSPGAAKEFVDSCYLYKQKRA